MDKNEDIKKPPAIPQTAGDPADAALPPVAAAAAGEPGVESKSELPSISSPTMAPTMSDMAAAGDAPRIARPIEIARAAAEKFEESKSKGPHDAAPGSREIMLMGAPAAARASRRFSKFTLLAAAVVLAAAFGATAGVLATSGLARLAGEPAPAAQALAAQALAAEPPALQTTLTQLRSEVAALKASVDATGRNAGTQYSKLVERFDRVERAQSGANKSDAALPKDTAKDTPKETTGSITPPSTAAAPLPPAPVPASGTVPGWAVRDVYRGVAMLQSRVGGMVEVEPGDVLPGLGRIEAIRRQDGHWVVITSKGMITSMR
jgi:hypothetical protein